MSFKFKEKVIMRNEEYIPEYFVAVACDVHGSEMAEGSTGDCIAITIDESMQVWDGWDALYSIRVYHVTHDLDGSKIYDCVHEELANGKTEVILD